MIAFSSYFASKRAAKFGVFFIVFGTTLLLPLDSAGATATGPVNVICAKADGEQRTFTPSWDNSNRFFEGRGQISRLFCEGGYAGEYRVFVSNNLSDPSLDYYNGIAPVIAPPVVESQTPVSQPVDSPTVVDSPTAPSVPESPTVTAPPAPTNPDSSTATAPDTQTVQVDSPTVVSSPTVPETQPTVCCQSESATPILPSETLSVVAPVETSTPTTQEPVIVQPTPAPAVQEPSPTPAPTVNEPVAVVPAPIPAQPEPAPSPEIAQPEPEQVEPPAPEPSQPEPVEPEPAPPVPADPAPEPEPAPEPDPIAIADPVPAPDPVALPDPEPTIDPAPVEPIPVPVNSDPSPAPVSISEVNVETLPPETPVELENGVILTAEVVVALQLLENPAELLGAIFSDPGQALMALGNIGADMSPEVREKSEKVVVSAIIVGGIATQAAGLAAASTYRRNP